MPGILDQLPADMQREIAKRLDPAGLAKLTQLCKDLVAKSVFAGELENQLVKRIDDLKKAFELKTKDLQEGRRKMVPSSANKLASIALPKARAELYHRMIEEHKGLMKQMDTIDKALSDPKSRWEGGAAGPEGVCRTQERGERVDQAA